MPIELYEKNLETYNQVNRLFKHHDSVAVVQPCGTGKSYISLKWLEENSDKKTLYVSSYNTVLENFHKKVLKYSKEGVKFGQIYFCTYQYIATSSKKLPKDIDQVIFDEFQYTGANVTSRKLGEFFNENPDVKILGTSATPVRYMDGQRDMAEELFDGNVVSNLTLSEAIAKKILPTPKYITGLYKYKDNIEGYQEEIDKLEDNSLRNHYSDILKRLKEELSNLDGVKEIFDKHMDNKNGKYIIFCKNKEHLDSLANDIKEEKIDWFKSFNHKPNVFEISSDKTEKENENSIESFQDEGRDGVKLLLSVNMANEGLHIEGIDGVIMLRETMSRNMYIQQLGRALSVKSKNKKPIIFDLVGNVDNAGYIYTFLDEVNKDIFESIKKGKKDYIDINSFEVIDELRNIKSLIKDLKIKNNSWWDHIYSELAEVHYKKNFKPSPEYIGRVITPKYLKGYLTAYQISKLQEIEVLPYCERFNEDDLEEYEKLKKKIVTNPRQNTEIPYGDYTKEEALNIAIKNNEHLIMRYVDKYYHRRVNQKFELEDYINHCYVGLISSIKDHNSKTQFSMHVERKIRTELRDNLLYTESKDINDEEYAEGDLMAIFDAFDKKNLNASDHVLEEFEKDAIFNTLDTLTLRESRILKSLYGLCGKTSESHEEIANFLDVSIERVRQIERKALKKLSHPSRATNMTDKTEKELFVEINKSEEEAKKENDDKKRIKKIVKEIESSSFAREKLKELPDQDRRIIRYRIELYEKNRVPKISDQFEMSKDEIRAIEIDFVNNLKQIDDSMDGINSMSIDSRKKV